MGSRGCATQRPSARAWGAPRPATVPWASGSAVEVSLPLILILEDLNHLLFTTYLTTEISCCFWPLFLISHGLYMAVHSHFDFCPEIV